MNAAYRILGSRSCEAFLWIQDLGPWHRHKTVTNDAENVVAELRRGGFLPPGRRLIYIDSDGDAGELLLDGQRNFAGFGPAPKESTK